MNHHGYCSDYLNPRIFSEASYKEGKINYGPMSYQSVIICGMESAFPEFIDSLKEYVTEGGKVIFIGRTPFKSPGMKYKGDSTIREKMSDLIKGFPTNVIVMNEPTEGDITGLTKWTGQLLTEQNIIPGVKISNPEERLFLYQAENEEKPVFFFCNQNRDKSISFKALFDVNGLYPWKWDAETGKKSVYPANGNNLSIQLKPLESLLLVFSDEKGEISENKNRIAETRIDLSEYWLAEFIPVEGESFIKEIESLDDVAKMQGSETFGGTIIYRKTFEANKLSKLNLGKVAETAEVTLNGKNLGVKYWGERSFDISKSINENGQNELEIKVTTLLWNYCNSFTMEENPMAKLWADRNRIKDNKPLPVGLIGPVTVS
jgi:hypothetical protein